MGEETAGEAHLSLVRDIRNGLWEADIALDVPRTVLDAVISDAVTPRRSRDDQTKGERA